MSCFYFYLLISMVTCCHGWKVHFEQEDNFLDNNEIFADSRNQKIQWIFPGTKWCGDGDIAENDDDLGILAETDSCCRDHDKCDDILESGQSKHNLTNNSFYTKLNCRCDEQFYDCLKTAHLKSSKAVGHIYFNVLGTQCYRLDYPIVRCIKYHKLIKHRCVEYELNENAAQAWQWFDVPIF